jgi:hypothetical protein
MVVHPALGGRGRKIMLEFSMVYIVKHSLKKNKEECDLHIRKKAVHSTVMKNRS